MIWSTTAIKRRLPSVPFCMLGMGFFRAWTESVYLNPVIWFPVQSGFSSIIFDLLTALVLVCLAVWSRRLFPLFLKSSLRGITAALLIGSTSINFLSAVLSFGSIVFDWTAMWLGAIGTALALMLWAEYFGCINPLRIALYYSASIAAGCVISWFLQGMDFGQLWIGVCSLPVISMLCLSRAYAMLPQSDLPQPTNDRFSFPWKPVIIVALFTFVMTFIARFTGNEIGDNSNPGALLASLAVFACIIVRRGNFDFKLLWLFGIPVMLAALIPLGLFLPDLSVVSGVASSAAYALFLILIMAILGNMSYRYGICSLWLFSIERAVRLVFGKAGTIAGMCLSEITLPAWGFRSILIVSAIGLATVTISIFASEKSLSSMWGMVLKGQSENDDESAVRRRRIGMRCHSMSAEHDLTEREEEILLQLLQGKRPVRIAEELSIEVSTVRTHIKHIYQKLDVHSNKELMALVGVDIRER